MTTDVKISWVEFDSAPPSSDVNVSWVQFDSKPSATDVKFSWIEFDSDASEHTAAEPKQDSIKWGYGPMVIPKKKHHAKSHKQRQNEAILLTMLM